MRAWAVRAMQARVGAMHAPEALVIVPKDE
jgi:hypothetical protein